MYSVTEILNSEAEICEHLSTQMELPHSKTGFQEGWEHTPHYTEVWRVAHGDLEKKDTGFDVKLYAIALNWEE